MLKSFRPALAVLLLFTGAAQANEGYVMDARDSVVHDSSGNCVHTGFWEPGDAFVGCDGAVAAVETEQVIFAAVEPANPTIARVTLDADTFFDFDKARLKPAGIDKLDEMIETVPRYDKLLEVRITGHADRIGDADYNQQLALERAETVKQYLLEHSTLKPDMLKMISMGEKQPIVSCEGMRGQPLIDCLAPNRRVDINIEATEAR